MFRFLWIGLIILILTSCVSSGQPEVGVAAAKVEVPTAKFQIPAVEEGKYNVAFVYVGPHDDGGWTQAHDIGRLYLEENMKNVHTVYIENVPEGADAEQVLRSLARKGFDVVFATSFGFMDAAEIVADESPDVNVIHISGFKSNEKNFGNLFQAMEDMKYLNGLLAGSRAKMDGNPELGYVPTFPIPEEFRLGNAFALGVQKTCPECKIKIRWIHTWHNPDLEKEAALSLFDAGAQVVLNGGDTAIARFAPQGKWAVTYSWDGSCDSPKCLTAGYWIWGPIYQDIVERSRAGTWVGGWDYLDADAGGMGLYGFMPGETLQPGLVDLPPKDLDLVRERLSEMLRGEFDRFDIFSGPITDNQGNLVVAEGESLSQIDLDGFRQFGSKCLICMYWWNENIVAELPELE